MADAALFLVEIRSGMHREVTWGNLMHISFEFDVLLVPSVEPGELSGFGKFRK